jgi:hypothetical protein
MVRAVVSGSGASHLRTLTARPSATSRPVNFSSPVGMQFHKDSDASVNVTQYPPGRPSFWLDRLSRHTTTSGSANPGMCANLATFPGVTNNFCCQRFRYTAPELVLSVSYSLSGTKWSSLDSPDRADDETIQEIAATTQSDRDVICLGITSPYFSNAVVTKVALWPPKPNELLRVTRTFFSFALLAV